MNERYAENDVVYVTDFEGVEHRAELRRVFGLDHQDCDGDPCTHEDMKMWAAIWPKDGVWPLSESKVRHVWPIGGDWDRIRPKKLRPLDVEEAEARKKAEAEKLPMRLGIVAGLADDGRERDVMRVEKDGSVTYGRQLSPSERVRTLESAQRSGGGLAGQAAFYLLVASELARLDEESRKNR